MTYGPIRYYATRAALLAGRRPKPPAPKPDSATPQPKAQTDCNKENRNERDKAKP
jgi:hypothetical protein